MGNWGGGISGEVMFEQRLEVRDEARDYMGGVFQAEGTANAQPCDRNRLKYSKKARLVGGSVVWSLTSVQSALYPGPERRGGPTGWGQRAAVEVVRNDLRNDRSDPGCI